MAQAAPTDEFAAANGVLSRARPGLDPQGLQLGGFTLFPTLTASLSYDDNIYDDNSFDRRSAIYVIQPSVALQSNWSTHELDLTGTGSIQRYTADSGANFDQFSISGHGRLDVSHNVALTTTALYGRETEPRGSAGDVAVGGTPSIYRDFGGTEAATATFGRLQLSLTGGATRFLYNQVRQADGMIASQAFRNATDYTGQAQVGYEIGPGLVGFVQGTYEKLVYDEKGPTDLSSKGYTLQGGVNFKITNLVVGTIGAGYLHRTYTNPEFNSIGGLSYNGQVVWNITTLVTLTVNANKSIEESPFLNVSGIVANTAGAKVDYEILRNLLLNGRFAYTVERYRGVSRTDHRKQEGVGLTYLMNRFIQLGLDYDRRDQNGDGVFGRSYDGNTVLFSIKLQR
jgi:hypothetical protein